MPRTAVAGHVGAGPVAQPAVARAAAAGLAVRRLRVRSGRPRRGAPAAAAGGPVAAPVPVGRRVRPVAGVHRHGLDGRPEADHRQGAHVARRTAQPGRPANVMIRSVFSI